MTSFVKRHQILIVSIFIVLFSLHLALTDRGARQRGAFLDRIFSVAVTPVQDAVLGTYNVVASVFQDYFFLVGVKKENEALRDAVTALTEENNRLTEDLLLSSRLKELLVYKETLPFSTIASDILAYNIDRWTQTITIDKGAADGVEKEMSVITPLGVVGRVIDVNPGTSRVLLSTDIRSNIEAVVQRTRVKGVVEGNGTGGLVLKYVRELDDVKIGDMIITSGFSGLFPRGIVIGEVSRIEKGVDNFFNYIEVRPGVDLKTLEEVLVVEDPGLKS